LVTSIHPSDFVSVPEHTKYCYLGAFALALLSFQNVLLWKISYAGSITNFTSLYWSSY
jgi:hypothetical protein